MRYPDPKPGLIIRYAYLWNEQAKRGQQEGLKDRPCLILDVDEKPGRRIVSVLPITRNVQHGFTKPVEIPHRTIARLGLRENQQWIVTTEGNRFTWPGFDVRGIPDKRDEKYAYGMLPRALFIQARDAFNEHVYERRFYGVGRDKRDARLASAARRERLGETEKPRGNNGPERE